MSAFSPATPGTAISSGTTPTYRVFLSYSHADTTWARWLMRRLENYRVPPRFHGRAAPIGSIGPRLAPVFRDRDELPTTNDLGGTIRAALAASATLVVICSPNSAQSRWVQEEILAFKRLHGEHRVFALIVGGEPKEGAPDDCFPPALRSEIGPDGTLSARPAEIVAADARPHGDGREGAFVRLLAGLLGVGFDELRQRELQRRQRRLTLITAASVCGMALTLGLAAYAWRARTDALEARNDARRRQEQAEDLLGFMVGDLRVPLAKLNKLDVLDAVGEKAMAYFGALNPRDLTDTALRRQAEALRQIGENRFDQARYPEALNSLRASFKSADTLVKRSPRTSDYLFERGQTEFMIGLVERRRGNIPEVTRWFTRYRDTGVALSALDPANTRSHQELAYGHHNLAVLDAEEERLEPAQRGFVAELAMLQRVLRAKPGDLELQFSIADVNSWLGSIAEKNGDFAGAAARFDEQVKLTESILRTEPDNAKSKRRLADALVLQSSIATLTGHRDAALATRRRAIALLDSLAAGDPKNQSWQRLLLWWRLKLAELLHADGKLADASRLADEVREKLEKLVAADPKDPGLAERLVVAFRLQARLLDAQGQSGAAEAAARAVELAERLVAERPKFMFVSECAQSRLAAASIAHRAGRPDEARRHVARALELLEPRLPGSNHWRFLQPAAQAYALAGQPERSQALIDQLERLGFRPLEPWPTFAPSTPVSPPNKT